MSSLRHQLMSNNYKAKTKQITKLAAHQTIIVVQLLFFYLAILLL